MQGHREFLAFAVPGIFLGAVGGWWMIAALWGTSLDHAAMIAAYPAFGVFMCGILLIGRRYSGGPPGADRELRGANAPIFRASRIDNLSVWNL